jgi:hypothetical protein
MTTGGYEAAGQYGSAKVRPGGLLRRFFARLIDGIIVTIIGSLSIVAIFSFGRLSDYLVTGLFTGILMFVYFVAFESGWVGRSARRCSGSPYADRMGPRSRT